VGSPCPAGWVGGPGSGTGWQNEQIAQKKKKEKEKKKWDRHLYHPSRGKKGMDYKGKLGGVQTINQRKHQNHGGRYKNVYLKKAGGTYTGDTNKSILSRMEGQKIDNGETVLSALPH